MSEGGEKFGTVRVLTIEAATSIVPLSKDTLYRVARSGNGPFRKREGKWLTTDADLIEWVRTGEKGKPTGTSPDPMPKRRVRGKMEQQVKLRRGI